MNTITLILLLTMVSGQETSITHKDMYPSIKACQLAAFDLGMGLVATGNVKRVRYACIKVGEEV